MRLHLVLSLVCAAGCGTSIAVTPINPSPKPLVARSPDSVELFTTSGPPRPYVDVAYLEAEQDSELSADGTAEFFSELRKQAARMGCDGVIIGQPTNRVTGSIADDAKPVSIQGHTATCIVYRPEPEPVISHAIQAPPQ